MKATRGPIHDYLGSNDSGTLRLSAGKETTIDEIKTAKSFLIETSVSEKDIRRVVNSLLVVKE